MKQVLLVLYFISYLLFWPTFGYINIEALQLTQKTINTLIIKGIESDQWSNQSSIRM